MRLASTHRHSCFHAPASTDADRPSRHLPFIPTCILIRTPLAFTPLAFYHPVYLETMLFLQKDRVFGHATPISNGQFFMVTPTPAMTSSAAPFPARTSFAIFGLIIPYQALVETRNALLYGTLERDSLFNQYTVGHLTDWATRSSQPATIGGRFYTTRRHRRKLLFTPKHFKPTFFHLRRLWRMLRFTTLPLANIFTYSATSGGYYRPTRASSGSFHSTPTSADFYFAVVPLSLAYTFLARAIFGEHCPKSRLWSRL
ncbi:hypothetical protein HanIR_Chr07g0310721 [Helianthus annuus]|nr:hypothetical protein HanIR_Chr07g0310721 [Helianthus annuus]